MLVAERFRVEPGSSVRRLGRERSQTAEKEGRVPTPWLQGERARDTGHKGLMPGVATRGPGIT